MNNRLITVAELLMLLIGLIQGATVAIQLLQRLKPWRLFRLPRTKF